VIQSFEQSHCHLHLFRSIGHEWDYRTTIEEHESIAEAIRAAEPAQAEDKMRQHLQSAYMRFFNAMTDQNEDPAELRASVSPRLIIG
jgi:DNA-binding GntR family transcriptional regulator